MRIQICEFESDYAIQYPLCILLWNGLVLDSKLFCSSSRLVSSSKGYCFWMSSNYNMPNPCIHLLWLSHGKVILFNEQRNVFTLNQIRHTHTQTNNILVCDTMNRQATRTICSFDYLAFAFCPTNFCWLETIQIECKSSRHLIKSKTSSCKMKFHFYCQYLMRAK